MNLVKCPNGHFYDSETSKECPYCNDPSVNMGKNGEQEQISNAAYDNQPQSEMNFDVGKTMGMYQQEIANEGVQNGVIEPVVGWLVCIDGNSKGKEFRLHTEKNFVGRETTNDVVIADDPRVSRKNHAIISFDPKKKKYRIFPGDGRGIVYLNDEEVFSVQDLSEYDTIEVGDTKFVFVPFLVEKYNWET